MTSEGPTSSIQVSQKLKDEVPDAVKEQAREMARQELARRLEELNMNAGEAGRYGALLTAVEAHIAQLHDLLESKPCDNEACSTSDNLV